MYGELQEFHDAAAFPPSLWMMASVPLMPGNETAIQGVLEVPEQFVGVAIPDVSKTAVVPGGGRISINWPEKNPGLPDIVMVKPCVVFAGPFKAYQASML